MLVHAWDQGLGASAAGSAPLRASNPTHPPTHSPAPHRAPRPAPPRCRTRAQGGEFAFVLLALANRLEILPEALNKLLIIVVVLSMALTPLLTEVGKRAGELVAARDGEGE